MLKNVLAKVKISPIGKIVLGFMIGLLVFTMWQLFFVPHTNGPLLSFAQQNPEPEAQIPALQQAGVNLGHATQLSEMSQQQAILLANQLEPLAASGAQHVDSRYILLNYPANGGPTDQQRFLNVPAWLIWYQHVPVQANDPAVDPAPLSHPQQDVYVFIDDHTGRELLALWV